MTVSDIVLAVDGLTITFGRSDTHFTAVDDLSFSVRAGEMLALVGESGSGKSLTASAVYGLLPRKASMTARSLRVAGHDVLTLKERQLRTVRNSRMGVVFQNPLSSLNPSRTVADQIGESYRLCTGADRRSARMHTQTLLEAVDIVDAAHRLDSYPHQLSGGMRQRVMLAMALANDPKLLIADEPTTALDVLVQRQILDLIKRLQKTCGMATLFITHNLALAAQYADTVLVMYAGRCMEQASAAAFFEGPRHPYSRSLLECIPKLDDSRARLQEIPGNSSTGTSDREQCLFAPRCGRATRECTTGRPSRSGDCSHPYFCIHPMGAA